MPTDKKQPVVLSWMPDLKSEADLDSLCVPYEVQAIPFPSINLIDSQYNGARIGDSIIRNLVEDYKVGMSNGDVFPRIVVHSSPTGFIILGGNQRCAAVNELIRDGLVSRDVLVEAYVVGTDDKLMLEIISRSGNVAHGGRSGKEERIAHAIYAVRSLGMRSNDAAKIFMVTGGTVTNRIKADDERRRLAEIGINTDSVPVSSMLAISKIDEDIKPQIAKLVSQHKPSTDRLNATINSVRKAKTVAERIGVVKEFQNELSQENMRQKVRGRKPSSGKKVIGRPRRDKVIGTMQRLADFLDAGNGGEAFTDASDLQLVGKADNKAVRDLWDRMRFRMNMILKTMGDD